MATEIETRVLRSLAAFEIQPQDAKTVEGWGNAAVSVVCEVALGGYADLRPVLRQRAMALLGWMSHPQALETVALAITDPDPDLAVRAMRGAGRQGNEAAVERLGLILGDPQASSIRAAEAIKALRAVDSPAAREVLDEYKGVSAETHPHRAAPVVADVMRRPIGRGER